MSGFCVMHCAMCVGSQCLQIHALLRAVGAGQPRQNMLVVLLAVGHAAYSLFCLECAFVSSFFFIHLYQNVFRHLISHHLLVFFDPVRDYMWRHIVVWGGCGCCAIFCLQCWAILFFLGFVQKMFSDQKGVMEFLLIVEVVC